MNENQKRAAAKAVAAVFAVSSLALLPSLLSGGCGGGNNKTSAASRFDRSRAAALIAGHTSAYKRIGMTAAVVKGGELLWTGGVGKADVARGTAAEENSVFLIASISKTVTAAAVMQLAEQNRLNLDADVNGYLPFAVRNPAHLDRPITLRQLLAHTSGLSDAYFNTIAIPDGVPNPAIYTREGDPPVALADYCREFFAPGGRYYDPATFAANAPGTHFEYSNQGITLAGYVVEAVSGQEFSAYCRARLFVPLGMTRTSWRVGDFTPDDLAMPYESDGEPLGNYTFVDYPNGGLRTTVRDLSRFLRACIGDGSLEGRRILQPASVAEMKRIQYPNLPEPEAKGFGLAWNYPDPTRPNLFGHAGGERGVSTLMEYNPATGAGVLLFQNQTVDSPEELEAALKLAADLIQLGER